MKIKRINFRQHHFFGTHSVNFSDGIHMSFLVGNNGAGKTKILDSIYGAFLNDNHDTGLFDYDIVLELTDVEKTLAGVRGDEITVTVQRLDAHIGRRQYIKNNSGQDYSSASVINLAKVVYSTIEVNFNQPAVTSVTSRDTDTETNPRNKSQNLSIDIPQLLVDLNNLDAQEISEYHRTIQGSTVTVRSDIGTKLKRFKDAFHKIFAGEKTFSKIANQDDEKKILFEDATGNQISLKDLSTGRSKLFIELDTF